MNYFITGIGTDIGKTLVSAILTKALQADYWKPVQAGLPRDAEKVKALINNNYSIIWPESYLLKNALSPHAAAQMEGVRIDLNKINLPEGDYENLIIEGAGGLMVPLNEKEFIIDLAVKFQAEIILVSDNYLGSINHTLLSINELKRRNLKVKGIIFNGDPSKETEDIILKHSGYPCLLRIVRENVIDEDVVNRYAVQLFEHWPND